MRKRTQRIVLFAVVFCMLALCFIPQMTAYAAGVSVSSKSCEVGDTVTVKVTFSQSNIGAVAAKFTYDSSILQFVSGSGASSSGKIALSAGEEGLSSLSASITFKALKAGTSTISVSTTEFYDMDMNPVGNVSGSGKVTVSTAVVSTPKPTTKTTKAPATPTPTPLPPISVTVDGTTLYIARSLSGITLPDGFDVSQITYESEAIQAAVRTDGQLSLLYLTEPDGANGAFYLLDESAEAFYPYINLASSGTYTVLALPSSVNAPDDYHQADLVINDHTVAVWQQTAGRNPSFYLLYVLNPDGEAGFYLYDTDEGTIQRYVDHSVPTPTPTPVPQLTLWQTIKSNQALLLLLGALLIVSIVLIVMLIVLSRKHRMVQKARPLLDDPTDPPPQEPKENQ